MLDFLWHRSGDMKESEIVYQFERIKQATRQKASHQDDNKLF